MSTEDIKKQTDGQEHHSHHHHHHHHHHHSSKTKKTKNKIFLDNLFNINSGKKGKLKTAPFVIGLIIIMLAFIIIAVAYSFKQKELRKANSDKLSNYEAQLNEEMNKEKENVEKYGVYYKLRNADSVNGIIIGDETGLSYGVSDSNNAWKTRLETSLKTDYGADISFEALSGIGFNTIESIINLEQKSLNYDIAIVCLGKNDNNEYFEQTYEALLHKLKTDTNMEVISIIDSSATAEVSEKIKQICDFYDTCYVDINEEIENSMYKKESLFTNNLPNDLCYEIYAQSIEEEIQNNIKIQKEISKPTAYLNSQAQYFETMNQILLGNFEKEGNRYTIKVNSPFVGIIYDGKRDGDSFTVYLNGEKVKTFSTNDAYELTSIDIFACGLEGENEVAIEADDGKVLNVKGILVK